MRTSAILFLILLTLCLAHASGEFGTPPAELQGVWKVKPEPAFPGGPVNDIFIRITPTEYTYRVRANAGDLAVLDMNGEKMKEAITNGVRYYESPHFAVKVNTTANPWQIDLTTTSKDGKVEIYQGLCELKGDSLKIDIGRPNAERVKNLEKHLGVIDAVRYQVTK